MRTTGRSLAILLFSIAFVAVGQIAVSAGDSGDEIMFQKGEVNLSPFGTYTDQAGGKWGAGAALTYYVTDKLGLGAATYWTDLGGTVFDNAEAEAYLRLPLFRVIAPYAVGSVGYQFDREYWFETLGAGLDFRPFKHIEAFSDAQYRFSNKDSASKSGAFIRVGVRFTF